MTLDAATTTSAIQSAKALPHFTSDDYHADLLELLGTLVNFELPGVEDDLSRWLGWMLTGGSRPKATMRTTYANGINGYRITQDVVCTVLQRHVHLLDWDNPTHFKLIERATRPSPGTEPLSKPAQTK